MNWQAMLRALVLGAALPLFANAADVSIEPQPLGSALQDLAKQSNVQIIFFSNAVEGRHAPALNGTFTPEEAVALLLEGTGLTYYVLNDRTIEVAAKPVTPAPPPPVAALAAPLDEVEVIAEREKLNTMREELQRLEEQFYAEYNKVNTSPDYDIVCTTETRRNSRVTQRICAPAFLRETTREAEDIVCPKGRTGSLVAQKRCEIMFVTRIRCADPATLAKTADYQKSMRDILARHPELRALLEERHKLAQRFEAVQKENLAGAAPEGMVLSSRTSAVALTPCPSKRTRVGVPPDIRGFDYPVQSPPASITPAEQAALHGVPWPW